jgi:hypothetical protein
VDHQITGVGVMVTKQLAIAIAIGICIGSSIAFNKTFAAAPAFQTRIDFEQVFADATRQGSGYVDRAHKGDRLPIFKTVLPTCTAPLLRASGIPLRRSNLEPHCWSLRRIVFSVTRRHSERP